MRQQALKSFCTHRNESEVDRRNKFNYAISLTNKNFYLVH